MLEIKTTNLKGNHNVDSSNLKTRVKKIIDDFINLLIFISNMLAGYALHDSNNKVLAITGVFLLGLGIIRLLNMSFRELNDK